MNSASFEALEMVADRSGPTQFLQKGSLGLTKEGPHQAGLSLRWPSLSSRVGLPRS